MASSGLLMGFGKGLGDAATTYGNLTLQKLSGEAALRAAQLKRQQHLESIAGYTKQGQAVTHGQVLQGYDKPLYGQMDRDDNNQYYIDPSGKPLLLGRDQEAPKGSIRTNEASYNTLMKPKDVTPKYGVMGGKVEMFPGGVVPAGYKETTKEHYNRQFSKGGGSSNGSEIDPNSFKYKSAKLKYVEDQLKIFDEKNQYAENVNPQDKENAQLAAEAAFDARFMGWKKKTEPKTGQHLYEKPDGSLVDVYGTPIKMYSKQDFEITSNRVGPKNNIDKIVGITKGKYIEQNDTIVFTPKNTAELDSILAQIDASGIQFKARQGKGGLVTIDVSDEKKQSPKIKEMGNKSGLLSGGGQPAPNDTESKNTVSENQNPKETPKEISTQRKYSEIIEKETTVWGIDEEGQARRLLVKEKPVFRSGLPNRKFPEHVKKMEALGLVVPESEKTAYENAMQKAIKARDHYNKKNKSHDRQQ